MILIKMAAENAVIAVIILSPCMRISTCTQIDAYEPSEDDYWLFIAKLHDICFLVVSGRHICAPQRDKNMASPYKAL